MDKPIAGYGWYIKRIDNALAKNASRSLTNHQLTMQQSRILVLLAHAQQHALTLKELEAHFCAAQSTVAGLVSRMEKKKLVEAVSDPTDKRVKRVRLTELGDAMYRRCHEDMLRFEDNLTALLTNTEKELLLVLLKKLYDAIR